MLPHTFLFHEERRSLAATLPKSRHYIPKSHGIRVKVVCLAVTDTPLAAVHGLQFFLKVGLAYKYYNVLHVEDRKNSAINEG